MPKLTQVEKKFELTRHRDILSAIIDYMIIQAASDDLLKDQFNVVAEYYEGQKQQIEKYFQKKRLDKLQQRLHSLTKIPMHRVDLTFNDYIKGKTGYEIDIFENLQMRVDEIIVQNQIANKKQLGDVANILDFYKQKSLDPQKADILKKLVIKYANEVRTTKTTKVKLQATMGLATMRL